MDQVAVNHAKEQFERLSYVLQSALPPDHPANAEARRKAVRDHLECVTEIEGLNELEFPEGVSWFNTSRPFTAKHDLRGKIVLLDFWTFCCINCIHLLPELAKLEHKWMAHPVAFVGVHSAKFENEKNDEAIRQAVLRYEIEHPIVNDKDLIFWKRYGICCWPSILIIGPDLKPLALFQGDGHTSDIDLFISVALDFFEKKLGSHPLPLLLETKKQSDMRVSSPLKFPGKIAIDNAGQRLFISDSNNHRIVVTDLNGNFIEEIGQTGALGFRDGTFAECQFNRLQGLAYHKTETFERLYVADTENHALRMVDFRERRVSTLAGDGTRGQSLCGGMKGIEQSLSTPWDVAVAPDGKSLFIAMSGTHQIWTYALQEGIASNFSGDGQEMARNNTNRLRASWAQPSGLSVGSQELFIADSESSSIRSIHLASGKARTIAGGERDPKNLFAFGDKEGKSIEARFQHPLGVCWVEGELNRVVVMDTYNHRLKILDPVTGIATNWIGSGRPAHTDGKGLDAELYEPAGACISDDAKTLFICDTNNHAIRVVDIATASMSTLQLSGFPSPSASTNDDKSSGNDIKRLVNRDQVKGKQLGPFLVPTHQPGKGTLRLKPHALLPDHYHFTPGAPSKWQLIIPATSPFFSSSQVQSGLINTQTEEDLVIPFEIQPSIPHGETATAELELNIYYCSDDEGICLAEPLLFDIILKAGQELGPSEGIDTLVNVSLALEKIAIKD